MKWEAVVFVVPTYFEVLQCLLGEGCRCDKKLSFKGIWRLKRFTQKCYLLPGV